MRIVPSPTTDAVVRVLERHIEVTREWRAMEHDIVRRVVHGGVILVSRAAFYALLQSAAFTGWRTQDRLYLRGIPVSIDPALLGTDMRWVHTVPAQHAGFRHEESRRLRSKP